MEDVMVHAQSHTEQHATFKLEDIYCLECAEAVEQALRAQPHITSVHLDWPNNVVHVGYHPEMISPEAIERVIAGTGCACEPAAGTEGVAHDYAGQVRPPQARRLQRLQHGVDLLPITMATKNDRMQYELLATEAQPSLRAEPHAAMDHSTHTAMDHDAHAAMDHAMPMGHPLAGQETAGALDHAAMGREMAGMDHAAMGHDMSDPGTAAAMERDMRTRFFIALVLTIPTVLYAPLGMNVFGVRLPTFGLDVNLIMLVLTTPVVFYCGWIFIAGAYHSLRRGILNMSVLIATG